MYLCYANTLGCGTYDCCLSRVIGYKRERGVGMYVQGDGIVGEVGCRRGRKGLRLRGQGLEGLWVFRVGEHLEGVGDGLFVIEEKGEGHGSSAKLASEGMVAIGLLRA
jgi:hypothetical protein